MLKRKSSFVELAEDRIAAEGIELSDFWSGTEEEYEVRVAKIQEKVRKLGLPVPSRAAIICMDAYDFEVPFTHDKPAGKLRQVRRFVEQYEETFTDFERTDRQSMFDLIRYVTSDGATMPEGYLDKVFAQYEAAERSGL